MTSELRVDNLKGSTTGGSINVLGEGTSATTNLQQGLAKVWLRADADGATLLDSFNMTSITDNGTGDYTPTFANDFSNALYSLIATAQHGGSDNNDSRIMTQQDRNVTTGGSRIRRTTANGASNENDGDYNVSVHGDLA